MDLIEYDLIVLDCDGVILNSNFLKLNAFNDIVKSFGENSYSKYLSSDVNKLGVNRFEKFKFLCNNILSLKTKEIKIKYDILLEEYNLKLRNGLKNVEMTNFFNNPLFKNLNDVIVVSAAYEIELKEVLKEKGVLSFVSDSKIFGSPKNKVENIKSYLDGHTHLKCLLIGDSKSDYDTAKEMGFDFYYIDFWSAEENDVKNDLKDKSTKYFNLLDDVYLN